MARAGMGTVDYWMGLPIYDVVIYMNELDKQIEQENEAMRKG